MMNFNNCVLYKATRISISYTFFIVCVEVLNYLSHELYFSCALPESCVKIIHSFGFFMATQTGI